ncbi:MAG: nuclease [Planctomycetota bacterium]|nr:MAG: nuclease [Planctomycetota bacterium]
MGNDTTAPLPFDSSDPPVNPTDGPQRHFLGCDDLFPQLVARWLREQLPADELAGAWVVLPGARAHAALLSVLQTGVAEGSSDAWPELLTVGQLGDLLARPTLPELVREPELATQIAPVAGRLLRSHEWQRALESLPDAARALLLPEQADSPGARRSVAAKLRALHADLAAADLDGTDVAEARDSIGPDGERWLLFADLQRRVLRELASAGLSDPHERRRQSLDLPARAVPRVVLVGVVDVSPLLERQLARRVERIDILLPGESARAAELHDAWGRLQPEALAAHALPELLERWTVHENPAAQADALLREVDARPELAARDELVLCLPDRELHAPVRRRLSTRGFALRDAGGRPWRRSPLARCLAALREHLERRSAASFAALVRQPAFEAWFRARGLSSLVRPLDAYREAHLPASLPRHWRELVHETGEDASRARRVDESKARARALKAGRDALGELLGVFGRDAPRPAVELVAALRRALATLCTCEAGAELLGGPAAGRLREMLEQAEELPSHASFAPAELLQRIEEALADATVEERVQGTALDALGVGDLAFSSARAVLLAGFNEGSLPAMSRRHAWLPDGLCQELGLPHTAARSARDHWALLCALERGVDLRLHSGRQGREGDPLRTSRLAFAGDDAQALAAAHRALAPLPAVDAAPETPSVTPPTPLVAGSAPEIESLSVTDFDAFLASPYQCYVERILRRRGQDDSAHELDGGAFGSLAHELLENFGRSELRDSSDPEALTAWFDEALEQLRARRFGAEVAPAVSVQLHQLGWRLGHFARAQAAHAAAGWRIAHVEWKPTRPVVVRLGNEQIALRGRIDRIDVNASTGEWMLLDYKTGESGDSPDKDHGGKRGAWKKLQLPLYLELVAELDSERERFGDPALGYFVLPKSAASKAVMLAKWNAEDLAHARATAGEIVRRLRAGEIAALGAGRFLADDPSLRALSGLGLVGGPRTRSLGPLLPEADA